jgi:hypothetical protein
VLAITAGYNPPQQAVMKRPRASNTTPGRNGRGRPPVHQESWSKVSVVLFDRQIAHLDMFGGLERPKRTHR